MSFKPLAVTLAVALAGAAATPLLAAPAKGDVTRAQMQAEVKQIFDMADTNKDGFMSGAEFRVRMGAVLNRTPPGTRNAPTKQEAQKMLEAANAAFKAVDANGDNKLSRTEASKRPLAAFDMMDANRDGVLTMAEKIAAHQVAVPAAGAKAAAKPKAR
ncbi:MAG: hypothetical protein JWM75_2032 [Sphingomonas bacterium]|nr:hypothetical protein [Sphingomonas bacterium]